MPDLVRLPNPDDDPDGDLVETAAWWSPSDLVGLSSLRPECRSTNWLAVIDARPVAAPPADKGADGELAKELSRWRSNARSRVRRGHAPRRFVSAVIPERVQERVWGRLAKASTLDDVDAAFRDGAPDPKVLARPGPGGHRESELVDYWAARLRPALSMGVNSDVLVSRWLASQPVAKAVAPEPPLAAVPAARLWRVTQRFDTAELLQVLRSMWADSILAGVSTAGAQLGGAIIESQLGSFAVTVDWDHWTPGDPATAALFDDGGLAAMLDEAGISLTGIEGTTLDRLAQVLADGVTRGDNLATMAGAVQGVIDDPGRARLVAVTEVNRAMTSGALAVYRDHGITQWDWLVGNGACLACEDEASGNPHEMGDDEPPGHPGCRCAVSPVVVLPDGSIEEG